jgi:hypothetical protein
MRSGAWGPKLPACFHPEESGEALCLDASRFLVGEPRDSARDQQGSFAGGAVVPSSDTAGSWSATLSMRRAKTLQLFVEGDRALLVDTKAKPSQGLVLERFEADVEAALLGERGL